MNNTGSDIKRVKADSSVKEAVEDTIELIFLEAEKWCGKRNTFYQKPQVEFADIPGPYAEIWDDGRITIWLTSATANNYNEACTECAHEIIHCIAPAPSDSPMLCIGDKTSTVLEEGLAAAFQQYIHDEWLVGVQKKFEFPPDHKYYEEAAKLVRELRCYYPDAIIRLRKIKESLRLIDSKTIETAMPDLPPTLVENLGKCLSVLKAELELQGKAMEGVTR